MQYQIITDEEALKQFIDWLPELKSYEKYYLALFSRKKYSIQGMDSPAELQLRRLVCDKESIIKNLRQMEIRVGGWHKDLSIPQETLALYITHNPRSMKNAVEMMGRRCWDMMKEGQYDLHSESLTCIQQSGSRTCWVDFDIDQRDLKIDTDRLCNRLGKDHFRIIKTRGGYHLLVDPDRVKQYRKDQSLPPNWFTEITTEYPVDQSAGDLIPVVGTTQGGYTPHFIC